MRSPRWRGRAPRRRARRRPARAGRAPAPRVDGPPRGVLDRGVARSSSRVALASGRGGLPLLRGELDLPQPDALRRHLDALVLADQLERLLERERPRRDEAYGLVRARRPHVRQLLL